MIRNPSSTYKHTTIMLIAINFANGLNLLFHFLMGRMLGPADYSALVSLMAIFLIVSISGTAIRTTVAKYVSDFKAKKQDEKLAYLATASTKKLLLAGSIIFLVVTLCSSSVASFLKIDSPLPIIILGIVIMLYLVVFVIRGITQGLQMFEYFGASMIADSSIRLLLGILFVYIGWRVAGALGSFIFAAVLGVVIVSLPLRSLLLKERNPHIRSSEIYRYFWPTLLALFSFTLATQTDVIIVKHFFPPLRAGYYSAAATMGKIVLFFPAAIPVVMFPKTSERHSLGQETKGTLKKSLLATALLSGILTVCYFLFPSFLITFLFGRRYLDAASLVGMLGVAMTLFALVNILLFYFLSIRALNFVYLLTGCTLLEIALLWFFPQSLTQVILILIASALSLLLLTSCFSYFKKLI